MLLRIYTGYTACQYVTDEIKNRVFLRAKLSVSQDLNKGFGFLTV